MEHATSCRLSIQEYLALERQSETRTDYLDGQLFPRALSNLAHNLITGNILGEIHPKLRNRACEVLGSMMRLRTPAGFYTYPDVVAICGEPCLEDSEKDTLLNPTLIVEVFSKSTETYDREVKLPRYQTIPSVNEVLLIAQDRCHVEHRRRQAEDRWLLETMTGLDRVLELTSIGCRLALSEVYEDVLDAAGGQRP